MRFFSTLAVLGLAALGHAHVVLNLPVPFSESFTVNDNGPLDETGSNFPCKSVGTYTPQGPSTPMALGSSQPLEFKGSAVHGGGSCQISITYDTAPTKNSVWKVIHSIHGGCPMRDISGNNVGNAETISPSQYTFTVPEGLPTGEAVLAWTWFNKVGNREMYMNCAPITITGGSTRRDEDTLQSRNATQLVERDTAFYNGLPDMYRANIQSKACVTAEGSDIVFPSPGDSVEVNGGNLVPAPACGNVGGGSAPAPSQPASQVTSAPSTSAAAPSVTSSKASLPGGVFVTVPAPTGNTPTTTAAPSASTPPAQAPTQATTLTVIPTQASSAAPPTGTGGAGALSGPCTPEGQWNCIGGSSFQQCGSGVWSTPQQLAAGTTCTPGQTNSIDIHAIGSKRRAVRFSGAHIRRHLRSSS